MKYILTKTVLVKKRQQYHGFLLPTVIALGLGISIVSALALNTTAQNSVKLNGQYYDAVAREAAQSGVAAARACVEKQKDTTWSNEGTYSVSESTTSKLRPGTSCSGGTSTTAVADNSGFTSTYEVSNLQYLNTNKTAAIITSKGIVKIKGPGGNTVSTVTQTIRTYAQTGTKTGTVNSSQIATGATSACAVTGGTTSWVYCWGDDSYGQLGDRANHSGNVSTTPAAVTNGAEAAQTSSSSNPCGGLFQVGCAAATSGSEMSGKKVTKVSVGADHACAVATNSDDTNGRAYCWGRNNNGQLGDESTSDSTIPVAVYAKSAYVETIPAHCNWFAGVNPLGCWGTGVWVNAQNINHPTSALAGKDIIDITAGNQFTCALARDGTVGCWGDNDNEQLGNRSDDDSANYPQAVAQGDTTTVHIEETCSGFDLNLGIFGSFCLGTVIPAHDETSPPSALLGLKVIGLSVVKDATMCVLAVDPADTATNGAGYPICWGRGMGPRGSVPGNPGGYDCDVKGYVMANARIPVLASDSQKFTMLYTNDFVTGLADNGQIYWWGSNGYDKRTCTTSVCTGSLDGLSDKIAKNTDEEDKAVVNERLAATGGQHPPLVDSDISMQTSGTRALLTSKKNVSGTGGVSGASPSSKTGADGNGNTINHKGGNDAPTGPSCHPVTTDYYNAMGTGNPIAPIGPLYGSADDSVLGGQLFTNMSGTARGLLCTQTVLGAALYCQSFNREAYPDCVAPSGSSSRTQVPGGGVGTCIDDTTGKVCVTKNVPVYSATTTGGSQTTGGSPKGKTQVGTTKQTTCSDQTTTTRNTSQSSTGGSGRTGGTTSGGTTSSPYTLDINDSNMVRGQTGSGYVPSCQTTYNLSGATTMCTPDPIGPQPVYSDGWLKSKQVTSISTDPTGYTCVIASGTVACWGANDHGRLGVGDTNDHNVPTAVSGLTINSAAGSTTYSSSGAFNYPVPF